MISSNLIYYYIIYRIESIDIRNNYNLYINKKSIKKLYVLYLKIK